MKKIFIFIAVILGLFALSSTLVFQETNAFESALKIFVDQAAIDYLKDVLIPILLQQVSTIPIPNITGKIDAPIGNIEYDFTDIVLSNLQLPETDIAIIFNGIEVTEQNGAASIVMKWHYRGSIWPHPSDSGTANVYVSKLKVSLGTSITALPNGQASIAVESCVVDIGKLDIELHGGESWLYQIFVSLFNSVLKSAIQSTLTSVLSDEVAKLVNGILSSLPVSVPIGGGVEVDFGLVNDIIFSQGSYLETQHMGEFYVVADPQEAPFDRPVIPNLAPNRMLQIAASSFLLESGGYAYYSNGDLQIEITPDMIPAASPIQLNTSSFCVIVPKLCKIAPKQNMTVFVNASSIPSISINPIGIEGEFIGTLDFRIQYDNGTVAPAFVVENDSLVNATISIVNASSVGGVVNYVSGNLTQISSEVGNVPVKVLQKSIDILIKSIIIPLVNKVLARGVPLPTIAGVSFKGPQIGYADDYLYVSTDVVYQPSS